MTTLATFMAALDSNIVAIALPKISVDLSVGFSLLGWVLTGYLLAIAALSVQAGKIGDTYGRKKIYLLGFFVFGISSALCGISQSITELIAFRVVQGASAALLFSVSRPLLFEFFSSKQIGFALGINAAAWSVGSVAGPVIGGILVTLDWRLVFYVNVPIAGVAILIASKKIPSKKSSISIGVGLRGINPASSVLLAIAVSMILLWLSFFVSTFAVIGLLVVIPLVINENKSAEPLLHRDLRNSRGFVYSMFAIGALMAGNGGLAFAMSFYYQSVSNLPPDLSGVLIAPVSLALAITSVVSGRLYGMIRSPTLLAVIGTLLAGAGLLALGIAIMNHSPIWYTAALLFVIGFGGGFFWTPTLTTALRFSKPELTGAASGAFSMFVVIGTAVSVAVTIAVSAAFLPQSVVSQLYLGSIANLNVPQVDMFRQGIGQSVLILGMIEILSIPILLLVHRQRDALRM